MRMGSTVVGALAFVALAALAPLLPPWLISLATIAFANALVVLGLIILWRTGLVPFGQALFYAIGAYAVALIGRYTPIRDVFFVVFVGAVAAGIVAYLIGFLLARYREIAHAALRPPAEEGAGLDVEAIGGTQRLGLHQDAVQDH